MTEWDQDRQARLTSVGKVTAGLAVAASIFFFVIQPRLGVLDDELTNPIVPDSAIVASTDRVGEDFYHWTTLRLADPNSDRVTVDFSFEVSSPTTDGSASIVLTQDLADDLIVCDTEATESPDVPYERLNAQQKAAIVAFMQSQTSGISEGEQPAPAELAVAEQASGLTYTIIESTTYAPLARKHEDRDVEVQRVEFSCTFEDSAFWATAGSNRYLLLPALLTAAPAGNPTWYGIYSQRIATLAPGLDFIYERGLREPEIQSDATLRWNHWGRVTEPSDTAVRQEDAVRAVFSDVAVASAVQADIFWSGIGLGVVLAVLVAVASKLADVFIPMAVRRLTARRSRNPSARRQNR